MRLLFLIPSTVTILCSFTNQGSYDFGRIRVRGDPSINSRVRGDPSTYQDCPHPLSSSTPAAGVHRSGVLPQLGWWEAADPTSLSSPASGVCRSGVFLDSAHVLDKDLFLQHLSACDSSPQDRACWFSVEHWWWILACDPCADSPFLWFFFSLRQSNLVLSALHTCFL
jgi:hypothetical protein